MMWVTSSKISFVPACGEHVLDACRTEPWKALMYGSPEKLRFTADAINAVTDLLIAGTLAHAQGPPPSSHTGLLGS